MQTNQSRIDRTVTSLQQKGFTKEFYVDHPNKSTNKGLKPQNLTVISKHKISDFPESDNFTRIYAIQTDKGVKGFIRSHNAHPDYKKLKKFIKACKTRKFIAAPYPYHI